MPTRFLSDAEIERLEGWPEVIDQPELVRYFDLDGDDLVFVRRQHSPAGQLGVALQLCAQRWLGFVPNDLTAAPTEPITVLAGVLDVEPREIFEYAVRPQTRREHRPQVREHVGFRAGTLTELEALGDWMTEKALEHDRPSRLLGELAAELRGRRIERPAVDRLMRVVAAARERAGEQTFQRLASQLTPAVRDALDQLLIPDPTIAGRTRHAWLRSSPATISAKAMHRELEKRVFLIETIGADRFDLERLPPNRRSWLAQTGRQQTNQALQRMAPERRYPVLMAFCGGALQRVTDDALEVFDRALGTADRSAQRKREELDRRGRRDMQTTVRRFIDLSQVVLEAHDSGTDVLRLVERRIGITKLREDLDRARGVARPQDTGHLDILITDSGAAGRKLLASVIARLEFRSSGVDEDELLAGLRLIGQLVGDQRRWLPGFSPSGFIDKAWRPHVVDTSRGRLDRRAYELCAAYELRSALRAGRVWLTGSCRYADPSSLLLPDERWQPARASFAATVDRSLDGNERLAALADEQAVLLRRLADERDATSEASLTENGMALEDLNTADQTDGRLRRLIEPRLPELDLPELLIEVDGWTGFTDHLTPLSGNRRRSADMPALLYAVILAQATNLGLTGMARASEFTYQQLEWAWEQLCREDTLTAASARLVDYHHGLPLAQEWGAGRLSSSDGQRYAARGHGPGTTPLPRYFGHRRRGMQIYSWTSDQYSQYASKVITATVRDATHTLDGILDNHTVLPIEEHTTDTHGYTEMIFGAYDLLGLRFAPRIRDLGRQQLYRHGNPPDVESAEVLKQKIRPELITLLGRPAPPGRVAAARLGARFATACPAAGGLAAEPARPGLAGVREADQDELRTRLARRSRAPRTRQPAAEQGRAAARAAPRDLLRRRRHIRQRTRERQGEQALCLAIIVNAIIAWNTVYTQRVLDELRAAGELITTSDIEHISPLARQHIHLYGHYPFDVADRPNGHRPLRSSATSETLAPKPKTAEPRLTQTGQNCAVTTGGSEGEDVPDGVELRWRSGCDVTMRR